MPQATRVLDPEPIPDLAAYLAAGGGQALEAAAEVEPVDLIETVAAAGLRGRGGAGFPTGVKWRTIVENTSSIDPTAVIVNAAEGEPGTFKDRSILRANPYRVVEGALIAARAVGAPEVIFAVKSSFDVEIERLGRAIEEFGGRGLHDISMRIVDGPSSYLFGEESAMLEVAEGRQPFPRVTPPYRRGLDEPGSGSGNSAATVGLATAGGSADGPALVDNVETLANVPGIVLHGSDWFRSVGTEESPGTIVCTVVGDTRRHGVGEFPMGTPLWDVIEELGGGPRSGRTLIAAMSGTANAVIPADLFETGLSYEAMSAAGSGLGAAGFIVFDDETDLVAVAEGVSRFLAVESCGQCTPCKQDGLAIANHLDAILRSSATPRDLAVVDHRLGTVADGARCGLASQQQFAVGSLVELARDTVRAHVDQRIEASGRYLIAPIVDFVDGLAVVDETQLDKHPDWTVGGTDSGSTPAELYGADPVAVAVRTGAERAADRARDVDDNLDDDLDDVDVVPESDPFDVVRAHHRRVRTDLRSATAATGSDRPAALEELAASVERYLDMTGRVLYPLLARSTFTAREDVAWAADHDAERAARLTSRLRDEASGTSSEATTGTLDELIGELDDLIRVDEDVALPLLQACLDAAGVAALADALAETDRGESSVPTEGNTRSSA